MLTIGMYENGMFNWEIEFDDDFLDNPYFAASLDNRFTHDDSGLYFSGSEKEYREVIEKAIRDFGN